LETRKNHQLGHWPAVICSGLIGQSEWTALLAVNAVFEDGSPRNNGQSKDAAGQNDNPGSVQVVILCAFPKFFRPTYQYLSYPCLGIAVLIACNKEVASGKPKREKGGRPVSIGGMDGSRGKKRTRQY